MVHRDRDFTVIQGHGTQVYGQVLTYPAVSWFIREGQAFESAFRVEGMTADQTVHFVLDNPADDEKYVFLDSLRVSTGGPLWIDSFRDTTVNATGTALTAHNQNEAPDTDPASATFYAPQNDVTLSGNSPAKSDILGATGGQKQGDSFQSGGTLLPPGTNRHLRITSKGNGVNCSVGVDWHEFTVP